MTRTSEQSRDRYAQRESSSRISVIIPAYNAARCLRRAIDSVLQQDYRGFELIVVDDGSTDETALIADSYGRRLRLIRKSNGGLSSARNAGIKHAQGEYIAFLDADDWWLPSKLKLQAELMDNQPELVFCSTTTEVHSPEGGLIQLWRCGTVGTTALEEIFRVNAFVAGSGSAVMAKKTALLKAGGFDETLRSLEDIDMWMRLAAIGAYACIDTPLTAIEKHPDSMSGDLKVMRHSAIRVMKKNRSLLPPDKRSAFWRAAYAGMLSDYAKWSYRHGDSFRALADLLHGLVISPSHRGRQICGLILAILLRQTL